MWAAISDRVTVTLDPIEEVRSSGLVIPGDASATKHRTGVVTSVGRGVRDVTVGDRVLVSGYAGATVPGDDAARVVQEAEVLGVLQ